MDVKEKKGANTCQAKNKGRCRKGYEKVLIVPSQIFATLGGWRKSERNTGINLCCGCFTNNATKGKGEVQEIEDKSDARGKKGTYASLGKTSGIPLLK